MSPQNPSFSTPIAFASPNEEVDNNSSTQHCKEMFQMSSGSCKPAVQRKALSKKDNLNNICVQILQAGVAQDFNLKKMKLGGPQRGDGRPLSTVCVNHEKEIQWLNAQLDEAHTVAANMKMKFQEERDLNESLLKEIHYSGMEHEKEKEEMIHTVQELETTLKETCMEKDAVKEEVTQLKQHLVDKEIEKSNKTEMDIRIVQELLANSEHQRTRIMNLEKALKQETTDFEERENTRNAEVSTLNEVIETLNHKLFEHINMVNSKNAELQSLKTALYQLSAENKSKELLESSLALSREESLKLSEMLKAANKELEESKMQRNEMSSKLSHAERKLVEDNCTLQKLQEENSRLCLTIRQRMAETSSMSMDLEYFIDRRIMIELLTTYIQRSHDKEVLELMVSMLGFSDEDKQKIGFKREDVEGFAGAGLHRCFLDSVLKGSFEVSLDAKVQNQSLVDLWVEFLLKESEQLEGEESRADSKSPTADSTSCSISGAFLQPESITTTMVNPVLSPSNQFSCHFVAEENVSSQLDSVFATIPLASSSPPKSKQVQRSCKSSNMK